MKKMFKKLFNLTCAVAMMSYMFAPLSVLATDSITIAFEVENGAAFGIAPTETNKGPLKVSVVSGQGGDDISFKGAGGAGIDDDVTITCDSQVKCTAVITGQSEVSLMYHDDFMDITEGPTLIGTSTKFTQGTSLSIKTPAQQNPPSGGGEGGGVSHPQFDGKAVAVWSCGDAICYHEFTNLSDHEVNFIKASDVTDDRDATKKFDVHASNKFFAVKEVFDQRKAEIDNNTVKIEDLIGPDGIDYMPVGEPTENNALVGYGNREFKAIIYGDEFKGVTIGDLNDLDYYPRSWNDWFLRRETYDMGGTTKDNPVEIDTVLLQKKINLKLQTNLNNYTVTKIEALDVPDDAVTITKKNDGSYDFEFNSNYFDKVVFKVTTSDNKEQFIYINRRTTDPWIRTDNGKEGIVVETFFDRNKSYSDLDVVAKIVNKDGSARIVHLTAEKGIDDGLGNYHDDYEVDEQTTGNANQPKGKGMKRANFVYSMSKEDLKKVEKIYINVEFKGSTSTVFAGNFVGSGKGDVIEMKYWEDRLN